MGCTEPERNIIGLGVRLTLYMQALGFIVLLFRGSISGAASAAEQSMVVYLAILFSLLSIDVQTSPGGGEGWKYFSDKEIVALSHLSTLYTAMFAVARSAKEMIYWQVWLVNFLRSEAKRRRNGLRFPEEDEKEVSSARWQFLAFCALTFLPSFIINILFLVFWVSGFRQLRCSVSEPTYGYLFYRFQAYGWLRCVYLILSIWMLVGTVCAVIYLTYIARFSERLKVVAIASLQAGRAGAENTMGQFSSMESLLLGAISQYMQDRGNCVKTGRFLAALLLSFLALHAVAMELTLHWNELPVAMSNASEWSKLKNFSQLFPFVVGACALMQAFLPIAVTASEFEITGLLECHERPEGLFSTSRSTIKGATEYFARKFNPLFIPHQKTFS